LPHGQDEPPHGADRRKTVHAHGFTGNPGTAKTTVARLVATILKDNGVLSVGDLHEVGRADLVGRFVGWTAKIVKERVRVAKGSVLFIDEAYAFVDEKRGMFGDEAINTLVQEMENNREDTVIIFAGYTDPMKEFLERNPGLPGASRSMFTSPITTTRNSSKSHS
jgi:AAA+ superfamily predicted ATPase